MKKFVASILFMLTILAPSLSFAIDRCGFICRQEASPYYTLCKNNLDKCSQRMMNSNEVNLVDCQFQYDKCMKDVRDYQLNCLDMCIKGDDPYYN